ncbi:MAG: diguanylate cyclase [Magnetococcales bacterium]|nr:diguanylate cyclase [Magnetococcales bacterium]
MKLQAKTTLLSVSLSGAMVVLLMTVSLVSFRFFSLSTARDHVRSVAEVVRVSLTESMINNTIGNRAQFLERLSEVEGLLVARVVRGSHVINQYGDALEEGSHISAIEQEVLKTGTAHFAMIDGDKGPTFQGTIPFVATNVGAPNCLACHEVISGTVLGAVTIHLSMNRLKEEALITISIMFIIVLVFAAFFTYFFRRQISPVVRTAQGVSKVVSKAKDGDFSGRIDYRGSDEMGLISKDLNHLMEHLQENLGAISHDVSRLMRYELKGNTNMITTTTEMVETLLEVAQFKQAVEEDQTIQEVYSRIGYMLEEHFGVNHYSIYEVNGEDNHIRPVIVDNVLDSPCRWCDSSILNQADACRAQRTGHVIDSIDNRRICGKFNVEELDGVGVGHICIPVLHSGSVGNIVQIVVPLNHGRLYQNLLPFIRVFLRESSPTVEAKRLLDTLRETALRDPMTGLHNRRFLEEYLDTLMATTRRKGQRLSILIMDLDHFKKVNDTHGHDVGDLVLRSLAKELSSKVRTSDMVIRFGGEEFLVILQESEEYSGPQLAEKIRASVEALKIQIPNGILRKTLSIGVAGFPSDGEDVWDVIKAADLALYEAKRTGRNRVVVFTDALLTPPPEAGQGERG